MKQLDFTRTAGNVIFVLGCFIFFLLVFEDGLVIPVWLQPVGRMHPMLLHLPIVLVLLAIVMEWLRPRTGEHPDTGYEKFFSFVLFGGVLTSGLTVIMGIFLAREGYDAAMLSGHKWLGVITFYLAAGMFTLRSRPWFSGHVARIVATAAAVSVVIAGHLGASVTHGEHFIAPGLLVADTQENISPEEAIAFNDVIRPILEEKCISCHNREKSKGKLLLQDSASLVKGGKSGLLFVSGKPDESLLIERLGLPVTEKKHMPPSGKPQLSREERLLIYYWVKGGGAFNTRLADLHPEDTFRTLALASLNEKAQRNRPYDFPAVAHQELQELNSDYRVIRPVALNSPGLSVNLYNRHAYSATSLDELKRVSQQVVSLHLSKLPVKDEDVSYIRRFENLETLNLNFTAVTDAALDELTRLPRLRSLSLAGTPLSDEAIRRVLPAFKSLTSLSIWETNVTPAELKQLRKDFPHIRIEGNDSYEGIGMIRLNPPRLKNKVIVFEDTLHARLYHPVRGVEIRLTTDGSAPDSIAGTLADGDLVVDHTTEIRARAFKPGWLSSDLVSLPVYKRRHTPDTAILLSKLNRVHTAKGAYTFFDKELGSFNANSPAWANNWGGVIGNDLELLLKYDSPREVRAVSLRTLIELETFLFPPSKIEVWGGSSATELRLLGRAAPGIPGEYRKPYIQLFDCTFAPAQVSYLKIIATPVMKLPPWHKRKDKPALLLMDEILVN